MSERRSRACDALAEQRSALVDGALDDADRERVLAHLVDCPSCRAEVAELRRIRLMLTTDGAPESAPPSLDLADRLMAIAGSDARQPLAAAPFRQSGTSTLRRRRHGVAKVGATVGALGAGAILVAAVGLSAAPPVAATIADPTTSAQAEFGAAVAQLPLADSVGSVAMASGQSLAVVLSFSAPSAIGPLASVGVVRELDEAASVAELQRSAEAAGELSYRGAQSYQVLTDGVVVGSRYLVQTRSGVDRELAVLDASGRQVLSTVTADPAARAVDSDELTLLAQNYVLIGTHGVRVAGRSATVVSAISPSGFTAARWWVDDATGLLLWHETYDSAGRTTLSAGFTEVTIGDADAASQAPARSGVPLTTTSMTVSGTGGLVADGWTCPDSIAGLSLIRVRTDSATVPTVIHLGYTDGVSSVSVFEQHGSLGHTPAGTHWDADLQAYVRGGAAKVASWQSGSTVFTVVTDGSPEQLTAAVAALPHDPAPPRTTIGRVRAGWSRILDSVTG